MKSTNFRRTVDPRKCNRENACLKNLYVYDMIVVIFWYEYHTSVFAVLACALQMDSVSLLWVRCSYVHCTGPKYYGLDANKQFITVIIAYSRKVWWEECLAVFLQDQCKKNLQEKLRYSARSCKTCKKNTCKTVFTGG